MCNEVNLKQLKYINHEIKALEDSLLAVRTRLTRISPVLSDMPYTKVDPDNRLINGLAQIIELEKTYRLKIEKLSDSEMKCISVINKIQNSIYRTILIERYINGKNFYQISEIFPYSYNHVCKLHSYAIKEYNNNLKK